MACLLSMYRAHGGRARRASAAIRSTVRRGRTGRSTLGLVPGLPAGNSSTWGPLLRWAPIVGPRAARKGACPRLHPRTYPHEQAFSEHLCGPSVNRFRLPASHPEAPVAAAASSDGRRPDPALQTGRRPAEGSRRDRPIRPTTRRRPTRRCRPRLLHAAKEGPEAQGRALARASAWPGPMPPHLASLTLTPATTPTRRSKYFGSTQLLIGHDRQRRAFLEPARADRAARRGTAAR